MAGQLHDTAPARRADYGAVRLGRRDIDGLILCAEHYGAPYDLLAAALGAQPARIRCNQCQRRMHGITRTGRASATRYTYYVCPHDPKNPRHAQAHPQHARTSVNEEIVTAALARFMDTYLLGHDRAAMLQVQLPAGAAEQADRRDQQAQALRRKLARIETAQKGLMTQAEQLGDETSPAANALRDRIREQFTERYNQHTAVKAELDALTAGPAPAVNDPALLDELPYAPGLLQDAPAVRRRSGFR